MPQPVQLPAAESRPQLPETVVDAVDLFEEPGRSNRPKRVAIVLRGLPGSGKSAIARALRDAEIKAGGKPPRLLSKDDYFMTEVTKDVYENENGRKGKRKHITVMEYSYEAEMEGAYQRSLVKAFQRTVGEGRYLMVIVDACNLSVDDVKTFWSAGQAAGYEVYILRPLTTDPAACAANSSHGRPLSDIQEAAAAWQEPPPVYPLLDCARLLPARLGGRNTGLIQEVEMDEGGARAGGGSGGRGATDEGSDEEEDPLQAVVAKSRWAALDDDFPEEAASKGKGKRGRRTDAAEQPAQAKKLPPSILAGSTPRKPGIRVQWADRVQRPAGFHVGGSTYELEHVLVVRGLGPSKDESGSGDGAGTGRSFADAVHSEHQGERSLFRDLLLGKH